MAFFSIGLPTYKRREPLRQAIEALLRQTFADFEIVVGNDDSSETLTAEALGIPDPRLRIVNHPRNLGEAGNMNALLQLGRGRYFTWQFDDDLTHPRFLEEVHRAIQKSPGVPVVFTSFELIEQDVAPAFSTKGTEPEVLTGREFLRSYFEGRRKAMGCTGVYEIEQLRRMGGMTRLCDAKAAIYGEYLLLIQSGLLERVAHVDLPLVFFRVHPDSWTSAHGSAEIFRGAGANLFARSIEILRQEPLRADFRKNLRSVLRLVCGGIIGKLHQLHGHFPLRATLDYLCVLQGRLKLLQGDSCHGPARRAIAREKLEMLRIAVCERLKSILTGSAEQIIPPRTRGTDMKLSIVSPTFNCGERLRAHIASVSRQRLRPMEHILVDNLSTDGTAEVIAAYQQTVEYPVIHIRETDRGLYDAMNKGIRRARGEWVHVFNSDNVYSNDSVLEQALNRDLTGCDIIACGVHVGPEETERSEPVYLKPECNPSRSIFRFPHQGMLVRRDFYQQHGLYNHHFRIISDSIFIFRNCPKAKCLVVDLPLATLPGGGISGRRSLRNTWETVVLLLRYHPSPLGERLRETLRQILQYLRHGLLRRG